MPPPGEPARTAPAPPLSTEPEPASSLALVPSVLEEDEERRLSSPVAHLPVEIDVLIPVREFRVRNLLALAPGHVIESHWANGEDLPLAAGDVQLAWSEFEVIDAQLAVRVTRQA